jgi:predicted ribosome quality control (RQC) complex YloA/Tae2 family protein
LLIVCSLNFIPDILRSSRLKYYQFTRLVTEIIPRLEGARVQKIFQPAEFCVQIELYTGQATEYLTVRTRPGMVSLYLAPARTGPKGEAASDLCMKLRHGLANTICTGAVQTPGDRVLELAFGQAPDEHSLVIELFGVGGNLYLLDSSRRVAALLDHKAAAARGLAMGRTYAPPPQPEQTQAEPGEDDPIARLMARENLPSYNAAVAHLYEDLAADDSLERQRSSVRRELVRERKRLEKLISEQNKNIEQAGKAPWLRECGEMLAANFNQIKRGMYQAKLPDFYTGRGQLRTIPLDEALTPQQNLERYFKKSRKLESAAEFAHEALQEAVPALEKVSELLARLDAAAGRSEIDEVAVEAGVSTPDAPAKARKKRIVQRHQPYRRFVAADGSEILVGKGGKDNDELTFKIARGKDVWLHVSGSAGSHVVLRCTDGGVEPGHEALLDAACLALQYSSIKNEERADVDYTRRKHVSRPPRSAPGLVVLADRRTLHVKQDRARLERLNKTRPND